MSVYIKGLEMPKNCRECPLEQPYDGYNCYINEKSYSWGLSSRPSDCPLVPVPDHGRLIDADKLMDALPDDFSIPSTAAKVIERTIIPADRADKGDT